MKPRKEYFVDEPTACPQCGTAHMASQTYSDTVDFRNLVLDVSGLQRYHCSACKFSWETPSQRANNMNVMREEYGVQRDHIRQRDGLLSGPQIKAIREALNLNQREAANLFGGGANAFNKYETGEVLQSYAMDRLIRMAGHFGPYAVAFLNKLDSADADAAMPFMSSPLITDSVLIARSTWKVIQADSFHLVGAFKELEKALKHKQFEPTWEPSEVSASVSSPIREVNPMSTLSLH